MESIFVPPNSCASCDNTGIDISLRTTFFNEGDWICGYCGNLLGKYSNTSMPEVVAAIVRFVLLNRYFRFDSNSGANPLKLIADEVDTRIECVIGFREANLPVISNSEVMKVETRNNIPNSVQATADYIYRMKIDGGSAWISRLELLEPPYVVSIYHRSYLYNEGPLSSYTVKEVNVDFSWGKEAAQGVKVEDKYSGPIFERALGGR